MPERRKAIRLKEMNEITTTVISGDSHLSKDRVFYNLSEDISVSGARIRGNTFLPVDTVLKIDITLTTLKQKITALAKVKWIQSIFEDKWYEAGVEFMNTQSDMMRKLEPYILCRQNYTGLHACAPVYVFEKFNNPKSP